jgi:hypothetical protein
MDGYFSCHWCHVMQRESFKDERVADYLNRYYIPVKVDRELHPELDRRLMAFVETVRGSAGWPLNVFLTPEGYPVTGFSYVQRDGFYNALRELETEWRTRHDQIAPAAREYFEQTESDAGQAMLVKLPPQHFPKVVEAFVAQAMSIADELQGGFGDTTKFPSVPQLMALLGAIAAQPGIDPDVPAFVRLTLDSMAQRKLRDHVNGGFFRYTTDPDWQTPHYEKMLYDNAQLARLYLAAHRMWPGQGYAAVALDTLEFIQRDLASPSGGYFSSLSAVDRENFEGAAYLWTREELAAALEPALWRSGQLAGLERVGPESAALIRQQLRKAPRAVMPVDDKQLAGWNALVLLALLDAEQIAPGLRGTTDRLYASMLKQFVDDGRVKRFASGKAGAETTLQDQALVARSLAEYALQREDDAARETARQLVETAFEIYLDNGRWRRSLDTVFPADDTRWVLQDAVLESPVTALLRAGLLLDELPPALSKQVDELIVRLTRDMLDLPYHYASAIMLRQQYSDPPAAAVTPAATGN